MKLLHGDLEVVVESGESLADRDNFLFNIVKGDWSDVGVTVKLGTLEILTTGVRKDSINAVWGEWVKLPVCQVSDYLEITVWDKDHLRQQEVGRGRVLLGDPNQAWRRDGPVYLEGGKGRVNMKIGYIPATQAVKENLEVPKAYFPMRQGGTLTLYQDAHSVLIPGDIKSNGVFDDIGVAFRRAKKFIYIAGWSLWTGTRLERDKEILGELLKIKAAEGVRVLVLIWNEKFSAGLCAGLLNTFDEDTHKYFYKSSVHVEKVRRKLTSSSVLKEKLTETIWSHHQKLIIADDGQDDIVGFLGGLDLTKGRWDTPQHELFSTLAGDHRGDFHNGYLNVGESEGPREPWHDVHARLTGLATIDLLRNFEERWRKQVPKKAHLLLQSHEDDLIRAQRTIVKDEQITWQMQVVRSVDSDSAQFSSGRVAGACLLAAGRTLDSSLHASLVRAVRRAQRFLYVESQFFIGSSQAWLTEQDVCARNLLPLEITAKLVSKIAAGEEFRVYLVLPLLPEGNVKKLVVASSIKAILHFQYLTLQMMYSRIAEALKAAGSQLHPTDYLQVLWLGKTESLEDVRGARAPKEGSLAWQWRQRAHFLIYVHSKLLVADDAVIHLGSANLNQRSLDGSRDTELGITAAQVKRSPGGEEEVVDGTVAAFRRALWAEHTSGLSEEEEALADPASLVAFARVRELADEALQVFSSGTSNQRLRSRFVSYPIEVAKDGTVSARSGLEKLPYFDVPTLGARCPLIPTTTTV